MKKLDELKSFATYLGDTVNEERLSNVSFEPEEADEPYPGCLKYTIVSTRLCSADMQQLRIIKPLADYWDNQNIHLCIYLFIENKKLIGGQIHKYKTVDYEDGDSNSYELEPTLQEIKVVRRLLDYLTKEK